MTPLLLGTLQQLEHSQYWPPDELRAHQFRQLAELIRHATRTMPFYATRLRAAGLDGAGLGDGEALDPARWRDVPILTRREVQDAGAALHCSAIPAAHGAVVTDMTTGSVSMPLQIRRTALAAFFWNVFTLREELWHRRDIRARMGVIRRDDRRPAGHAGPFGSSMPSWGPPLAGVYPTGDLVMLDNRASIAEQVEWLLREQPAYLLTLPSHLLMLARHCLADGIAMPFLQGLRSSGEVLGEGIRAACRAAFDLGVWDMYSATEIGYIALQCPAHEHLHVQAESCLVEVLDARGRDCAPGETGQVVVTPLHNFAMPLLRYSLGDRAEVGPPCPCGRGLPVLSHIHGRTRDMLKLPDGTSQIAYVSRRDFGLFPAIIQHQVVQTARDAVALHLVLRRELTDDEAARLRSIVLDGLGHPFRLEIVVQEAIPAGPGGKFLEFRCDVLD